MGRTKKAHGGGKGRGGVAHLRSPKKRAHKTSIVTLKARNRALTESINRLRQAQKAIIQRERLHALGQMASGIVHDFNNALTPILGASDFLISNPDMLDSREEALALLQSIRTAGRDAKSMVRRLRGFYRPEEDAEVCAIDINPLVEQTILLTQPKWGKQAQASGRKINMEVNLGRIPRVRIDESHVREVLTNVILNAVDAMPSGGTIAVHTHHEKKWVVIEVSDTGTGMPEEVREHCFEPFFSTKGNEGTGMGLAVVYGIIKKYGGRIKIISELNKGTTFRFSLPAGDGAEQQAARDSAATPPPSKRLRVLLIDDDLPSRNIVAKCLAGDGHAVVTAEDSADALKKSDHHEFDIAFVDVATPGINGIDLAAQLKQALPDILVVMMTGSIEPGKDGENPPCVDLILDKPVTQMDLRRAIAAVLIKGD